MEKIDFKIGTHIALGYFDGVHMGHRALLKKAVDLKKAEGGYSIAYTFYNHPLTIINKNVSPKLLLNNECKKKIIENLGIDIVIFEEFNEKMMKLSKEEFITSLVVKYNVKSIIIGHNYKFGFKNSGDGEFLKMMSKKLNYNLYMVPEIRYDGHLVSSTYIRNLILSGKIQEANKLLTYKFTLEGFVIEGKKIGRKLDFPTANLSFNEDIIIPKSGVYHTNTIVDGNIFNSITNVGLNPTVNGDKISIETNILDYDNNIYNKKIKIKFIERIRDEIKFNSLEDLKEQIKKDREYAIHNSNLSIK